MGKVFSDVNEVARAHHADTDRIEVIGENVGAMSGRAHQGRMRRVHIAIECDVFAIVVAANTFRRQPHDQWIFTQKLVGQRVTLDHELRVLSGCASQALVERQRRETCLAALLVDEREQLLFGLRLDRVLCEARRRENEHCEQAARRESNAPATARTHGMCSVCVASHSIRRRKVTSVPVVANIQYSSGSARFEMINVTMITFAFAGLLLGVAITWLALRSKASALAQRKRELEQELILVRSQLGQAQAENSALNAAKAAAEATLESERSNTKEKLDLLNAASEEMKAQFKALASTALESNNASFLRLAKTELQKQQSEAESELEKRATAVETLVKPIAESLKNVDEHVRALESSRAEAYGGLKAMVESLQESQSALKAETGNLVKALREPQARGRWGEMQLRRALEFAGMLEYCDFDEQVSVFAVDVAGDRHALRPDVIVRLPGGKRIVIDSKVPLTEYLKALDAPDEKLRKSHLIGHARQVRDHVNALAAKAYWSQFEPTPEFVILFIPGEVFFRAAFMAEPEFSNRREQSLLASPITLVAMLRTIAYAWNQKNMAESARKISEAGKQLYDRLCVMTAHVDNLGKKLEGAVKSYNDMLSSMERRVFPAGRRLSELDRSLPAGNLVDPQQIEKVPRALDAPDWQLESEMNPLLLSGEEGDLRER